MKLEQTQKQNLFNRGYLTNILHIEKGDKLNYGCEHKNARLCYFCKDSMILFCKECKDEAVKHLTEHHCKGGLYAVEIEVSE